MLRRVEMSLGPLMSVAVQRLIAQTWRWRGAQVGAKTRVGARCVIQRPWVLSTGPRCQFEHDVFIKVVDDTASLRLGSEVFVGRGVAFDISCSLHIGNHVLIAPGCFITDHGHRRVAGATIESQGREDAPVHIEDDVWLGAKTVVLPGVRIGRGAIVGAGSVVTRDVDSMSIVAGAPARSVGMRT